MKIEKINDSQIRIFLTREDLLSRQIRLSELAYGTEKARRLFEDMMQKALHDYDFHTENTPLMIEAIPMHGGSIVLIVTKVDNPEEIDARFASYSSNVESSPAEPDTASPLDQLIQSLQGMFGKDAPAQKASPSEELMKKRREYERIREFHLLHQIYCFSSLNDAAQAASDALDFTGESALYYNEQDQTYYLSLTMKDVDELGAMQHVLSVISEFGEAAPVVFAREQYLREHCRVLIPEKALQSLALLGVRYH